MRLFAFAILASFASAAFGLQVPEPSGADPHVGYIDYNPDEIVQIVGVPGYQTTVIFSHDEKIEDLGSGYTAAWEIGPLQRENGFFIKMKSEMPNTNLAIVTNKRTYMFDLVMKGEEKKGEKSPVSLEMPKFGQRFYYFIKFRYPQDEKRKEIEGKDLAGIDEKLTTAGRKEYKNEEYWIQGTKELQPSATWDNGRFTYLKFAPNTSFPAVYEIDASGKEVMVDGHVEDDTIVVHRVKRKLILRRDGKVAAIYNEAYDVHGKENATKTVSDEVRRVLKNGKEEKQITPLNDTTGKVGK